MLVVERNITEQSTIEQVVQQLNIKPNMVVVNDGQAALDILKGRREATKLREPYIILLDSELLKLDGMLFLRELRAHPKLTDKVVFIMTDLSHTTNVIGLDKYNISGYLDRSQINEGLLKYLTMTLVK